LLRAIKNPGSARIFYLGICESFVFLEQLKLNGRAPEVQLFNHGIFQIFSELHGNRGWVVDQHLKGGRVGANLV